MSCTSHSEISQIGSIVSSGPYPVSMTLSIAPSIESTGQSKPFFKWAGGKGRLLKRLLPYVPESFGDYYEPFVGGGAMFFALADRMAGRSYLFDLNEVLVTVWQCAKHSPDELCEQLELYKAKDSESFYYSQRGVPPKDPIEQAAWFIYLNQTSWNGLWRVNKHGQFNVPWGKREFKGMDPERLRNVSRALARATVDVKDFRESLTLPRAGDFVYLDPPYLPISDTSKFYLYTEKRFRRPDLETLAELCHDLSDRGVNWMMSNRDTDAVHDLFPKNEIVRFTARRSVAAQNRRDVEASASPEALILGGALR